MREVEFTDEVKEFFENAESGVREKFNYILDIVIHQPVITAKIAKKLTNTPLYEIRIQVNNEYRVLSFTVDHKDINQAQKIIFLNAFLKKSTKDYDKQIKKALKILDRWTDQK